MGVERQRNAGRCRGMYRGGTLVDDDNELENERIRDRFPHLGGAARPARQIFRLSWRPLRNLRFLPVYYVTPFLFRYGRQTGHESTY